MAAQDGVNETLKARDYMHWTGLMNNIRNSTTEIINQEIICRLKTRGSFRYKETDPRILYEGNQRVILRCWLRLAE